MRRSSSWHCLVIAVFFLLGVAATAAGQTTAFTYQGRLTDGGTPANGNYDFIFQLYDAIDGDNLLGHEVGAPSVPVNDGIFSVTLDFGANAFPGADRFLQIIVRRTGDPGIPTLLSPRQKLTSTPYAIRSLSAATADVANNATQLGGTAANQFVLTGDARLSDSRPPTAGSNSYIQNGTVPQAGSSFNVSGDGAIGGNLNVGGSLSLNTVNANTQYNLGGVRVLSNAGTRNLFAGAGAGQANTTGAANAFFGNNAGPANDAGTSNSFFGSNAGFVNTSGSFNAFFGAGSGSANVDGNNNAFFGFTSGRTNASGFNNSFFGNAAGFGNTNGGNNSYFGFFAGKNNTLGQQNTFVGASTGATNVTGGNNTLLGYGADVGAPDNSNATAIGAQALVTQANSLVLGAINGVNGANFDTNVGIGTTAPSARLHVVGDGLFIGNLTVNGNLNGNLSLATVNAVTQYNLAGSRILSGDTTSNNFFAGFGTGGSITSGTRNAFFGSLAGVLTTSGNQNAFFGYQAGNQNSTGAANSFFGAQAGQKNTSGNGNSFFGGNAGLNNASGGDNSYFGVNAGNANTAGSFNSMFGESAGQNNTTVFNSFFGYQAGQMTSTGDTNAFFGFQAGQQNTGGARNAFFGAGSGSFTTGNRNAFVGTSAGGHNLTGSGNIAIGDTADFASGALQNATAIGNRASVSASNSLVLGGIAGVNNCTLANNCGDTNVGIGTTAPTARLHVVGDSLIAGNLTVTGTLNATVTGNFIQNTTTQQPTSNFNISGDGTAGGTLNGNFVNATTQYKLGGIGILSNPGTNNLFAGPSAGVFNNPGSFNSFFGAGAGGFTTGDDNSFFGEGAGRSNTTGVNNNIFGFFADLGSNNLSNATAIGTRALVTQSNSLILGSINGVNNATADTNVGIGTTAPATRLHVVSAQNPGFTVETNDASFAETQYVAGNYVWRTGVGGATVTNGAANKYYIYDINAGQFRMAIDTGGNVGIGTTSPTAKLHVAGDGLFTGNLTVNGTLNGNFAGNFIQNTTSQQASSNFNISGNGFVGGSVGVGTTSTQFKLNVVGGNTGLRVQAQNAGGSVASFGENGAFLIDASAGPGLSTPGGRFIVQENGSVGIGTNTPADVLQVVGQGTAIRATDGLVSTRLFSNASTSKGYVGTSGSNSFVLRTGDLDRVTIDPNGNVGIGIDTPEQNLQVVGQILSTGAQAGFKFRDPDANQDWTWHAHLVSTETAASLSFNGADYMSVSSASAQPQNSVASFPGFVIGRQLVSNEELQLNHLGSGGSTPLCRNSINYISDCSSSLRYKTNIAPFSSGLGFIRQLRPISFDWKQGGMHDIGFGAEDVAKINPLFVTYNQAGQVEGVKYDRFSTVFVNAFKEQQTQIEQQQEQIKKQQTEIDALKKLVCADHPNADVCAPRK